MIKQETYLSFRPQFENEKSRMKDFLERFEDKTINEKNKDKINGKLKYKIELQKIANKKSKVLEIHLDDMEDFFQIKDDVTLNNNILTNTKRYLKIFYEIVDSMMPLKDIQIKDDVK